MRQSLLAAIADAAYWRKQFDDACPDVGMGTLIETHVDDAIKASGATLTDQERTGIVSKLSKRKR